MNSWLVYFLNTHGVFVLFILVIGYLWLIEKSKEEVWHILLASLTAGLIAILIKEISSIPRPYVVEGLVPLAGYSVRTSSLPSLHTTLAFALATTVTLHQKKFGILLLCVAGLIGFGRVAANVHYPVDVGLGALLGTIIALAVEKFHIKTRS